MSTLVLYPKLLELEEPWLVRSLWREAPRGGDHIPMTLLSTSPQCPQKCLDNRWQAGVRHGVHVGRSALMELYRLACRYLVPEHGT
jgi:hypothetical protein